jgi:hypothetical protein
MTDWRTVAGLASHAEEAFSLDKLVCLQFVVSGAQVRRQRAKQHIVFPADERYFRIIEAPDRVEDALSSHPSRSMEDYGDVHERR